MGAQYPIGLTKNVVKHTFPLGRKQSVCGKNLEEKVLAHP